MWKIELAEGVAKVPRAHWNALVADDSPFLEWDWLASLEETGCVGPGTGWTPRPLLIREGERLIAACPLYLKEHSEGEFIFDWGWADAAQRAGIRYYPKLLVGVPFTPVTGSRLLVAPGEDRALWEPRLAQALKDICLRGACSGVHVNFCRESQLTALGETDYLIRMGFQYHWENAGYECFEDYLARFRSKRRNQIRREQREMESQGVVIETSAGEAIDDALFEPMYRFYLATIRTHYYGRRYLNRAFFELLGERFRRNLVLVVARQGDELIGGALNIAKGDTLYGRYWGALRPLRHLHFNVCYYAAVNYCIENRLSRFEPGAGGEYKQVRGFDAQPTWSGHFLVDPRLGEAVAKYLQSERQEAQRAIDWIRSESALKPAR